MRTTTADGHTLQLPDSSLPALLPALRRAGLGGVVRANYQGDTSNAVARTLKTVASRAHASGALRHTQTGRRFPVFTAAVAGREVEFITRPLGPSRSALLAVRAHTESESETGPGSADVHVAIFRHLQRLGLVDAGQKKNSSLPEARKVRWGMGQVDATGQATPSPPKAKRNKPDVSYVDAHGRRINVEVDTRRASMRGHMQRNVASDPNAVHVFLLVDRDGRVRERHTVTRRRDGTMTDRTRNFGPRGAPVGQVTRQLPRPTARKRAKQKESEFEFESELESEFESEFESFAPHGAANGRACRAGGSCCNDCRMG